MFGTDKALSHRRYQLCRLGPRRPPSQAPVIEKTDQSAAGDRLDFF